MANPKTHEEADIMHVTGMIAGAYLSNNRVDRSDLSTVICEVHDALADINAKNGKQKSLGKTSIDVPIPAVKIENSIHHDRITCLECGEDFKMIKKHIEATHEMSVESYLDKWNLAEDYPMTAPDTLQTMTSSASSRKVSSQIMPEVIEARKKGKLHLTH